MRILSRFCAPIACVATLAACGTTSTGPGGGTPGAKSLVVASHALHLQLGANHALPISVVDEHGNPLPLTGVSFSLHGRLVAAVDGGGLVDALEPGVDTVLIQLGSDTASIQIIVDYPAGITHPQGVVKTPAPLSGRPFGVAVTESGDVISTQLDLGSVSRGLLPTLTFTDSIAVGAIPTDVAVDAQGHYAYVTNQYSSNVGIVDLTTNTEVATIPLAISTFRVRLTPDGASLIVSGAGGFLYVIDVATRTVRDSIAVSPYVNGIAIDRTGSTAYVSDRDNGTITKIDLATASIVDTISVGGSPQEIVLSPGATVLFIADESGSVQSWSLRDHVKRGMITVPGGAFAMAVSPDWRQMYISSAYGGAVSLVNWADGSVLNTVTTGGTPRRIAFTHDGARAVVANEGGWVDTIE